jgi:hypothetical protein
MTVVGIVVVSGSRRTIGGLCGVLCTNPAKSSGTGSSTIVGQQPYCVILLTVVLPPKICSDRQGLIWVAGKILFRWVSIGLLMTCIVVFCSVGQSRS